jgi:hypothetical protein
MKVNKYLIVCFFLFFMTKSYLNGQIQLGLFSYSEFLHSPNGSNLGQKSFNTGYNKYNFSSLMGMSIGYKLDDKFSVFLEIQRVNRYFDHSCVNSALLKDFAYYISDTSCKYKLKAEYKILQVPISVRYSLPSINKNITHSIGVGNTIVYSLAREDLLYNNVESLNIKYRGGVISMFSPEIYYELDVLLFKHAYLNFVFGLREEMSHQFNDALFGKVGISYSIEKDKHRHKRVF